MSTPTPNSSSSNRTDPTTLDGLVLAAEAGIFLSPATLDDLGSTDDEIWSSIAELVPGPLAD